MSTGIRFLFWHTDWLAAGLCVWHGLGSTLGRLSGAPSSLLCFFHCFLLCPMSNFSCLLGTLLTAAWLNAPSGMVEHILWKGGEMFRQAVSDCYGEWAAERRSLPSLGLSSAILTSKVHLSALESILYISYSMCLIKKHWWPLSGNKLAWQ